MLNNAYYTELILTQKETVCFQIVDEAKTKDNKYGNSRQLWIKLSRKFDRTTGASKTRLLKKFTNNQIDDLTKNPNNGSPSFNYLEDT